MLYIFDLGNVIVDIDFKRVLGVWSNLSGTPLAVLSDRFAMGEVFQQHERGEISDEDFAGKLCDEMGIALSFEQFATGWQAVFVALRPEVIDIMQRLRNEGHRVVVLSNTNRLHCNYWPQHYPEVAAAADHLYLSQDPACASRRLISINMCWLRKTPPPPTRCSSTITRRTSSPRRRWGSRRCTSPIATWCRPILPNERRAR